MKKNDIYTTAAICFSSQFINIHSLPVMNINEKPGNAATCVKQLWKFCPKGDRIRQVTLYYNHMTLIDFYLLEFQLIKDYGIVKLGTFH